MAVTAEFSGTTGPSGDSLEPKEPTKRRFAEVMMDAGEALRFAIVIGGARLFQALARIHYSGGFSSQPRYTPPGTEPPPDTD